MSEMGTRYIFGFLAVTLLVFPATKSLALTIQKNYQLYDHGPGVTDLQKFLNAKGFPVTISGGGSPGHETDYFGALTYKALVKWQASVGLPATGYLGPMTRGLLAKDTTSTSGGSVSVSTPGTSAPATPTKSNTTSVATTSSTCSAPAGLSCIPGTSIIQPFAPGNGYTPGFGGGGSDVTAPSVTLTSPLNGETVSGSSITLSATASDNVGVAGVAFYVDGVQIGSEDTSAPYSVTYDSSAISLSDKTVTTVARDARGNTSSNSATVTVDNGIIYTNFNMYRNGFYSAYAGLWYLFDDPTLGLGHTAVEGVDYVSSSKVYPNTFTVGTKFIWRVPSPGYGGVFGYLHSDYGNYDHDYDAYAYTITPRQVYQITDLTSTFDISIETTGVTNVLHEFWLTSTSHQTGQLDDKVFEVGLFGRTPAGTAAYMAASTQVGTYKTAPLIGPSLRLPAELLHTLCLPLQVATTSTARSTGCQRFRSSLAME
ncbi:MAG TPA: Ig-like domain-containing protein [Candidatus Paceibacterota bacterium]|nr:Ig-like domain-containing protein [Candidatus Paceibacterota bacterium]